MFDILTAIYYGELGALWEKSVLDELWDPAEAALEARLGSLAPQMAEDLRRDIRVLAVGQRDEAFRRGVRFGAQLTAQLMEPF